MEDILTSNIFGLLKYVQPQDGILKYLSYAEDEDGKQRLKYLSSLDGVPREAITYEFWPWWKKEGRIGCEPDVVLALKIPDKQDLLVLIEAKYRSGKSSEADEANEKPNDQLAKEWDYLSERVDKPNTLPILIYLTAHYVYPEQHIKDSIKDFQDNSPEETKPVIYWLSWRHLYKVCENAVCDKTDKLILNDLARLLVRLNLKFFDDVNWEEYAGIQAIEWRFLI